MNPLVGQHDIPAVGRKRHSANVVAVQFEDRPDLRRGNIDNGQLTAESTGNKNVPLIQAALTQRREWQVDSRQFPKSQG